MSILRAPMTACMLLIFLVMVGVASTYPADARFMPFVVGIPAILLCLLQLALDARAGQSAPARADTRNEMEKAQERVSKMTGRQMEFEAAKIAPGIQIDETPEEIAKGREFHIWIYVLGFVAAIILFGFWVVIPIFIGLFLRREAKYSWAKAITYAVVGGGFLFAVFTFGLKLELHDGFVTGALRELRG